MLFPIISISISKPITRPDTLFIHYTYLFDKHISCTGTYLCNIYANVMVFPLVFVCLMTEYIYKRVSLYLGQFSEQF